MACVFVVITLLFSLSLLILVYGPRCWQRGAITQKRQFGAAPDVLCGVVLLKQQTQTLSSKKTHAAIGRYRKEMRPEPVAIRFVDQVNRMYCFAITIQLILTQQIYIQVRMSLNPISNSRAQYSSTF